MEVKKNNNGWEQVLPVKRFNENMQEVLKPSQDDFDWYNNLQNGDFSERYNHIFTYNQAQQRKVLVPLSEFHEILHKNRPFINKHDDHISEHADNDVATYGYRLYITQPITEKSLEGVECVVIDGDVLDKNNPFVQGYFLNMDYKTIEHAINDGVVFVLKND